MIGALLSTAWKWLSGIDLSGLKPLIPYAAAFAAGWLVQDYRLDGKALRAQMAAKDLEIQKAGIRADAQAALADARRAMLDDWKIAKAGADDRISALEATNLELLARTPKDTHTIIRDSGDETDAHIKDNPGDAWLLNPIPGRLLDNSNARIRDSQIRDLPAPALAGDHAGEGRAEDPAGLYP